MELIRDSALIIIALLLALQVPAVQDFVYEPGTSTSTGNLESISRDARGINSDTDNLRNLLTKAVFQNEDFAQESSVDDLENIARIIEEDGNLSAQNLSEINDRLDRIEAYTSGTENNTHSIENQTDDIDTLIGQDGRSTDSFGTLITKSTSNLLNLPSHEPYSRERWRVDVNGEKTNLQYNSITEYEKKTDVHYLNPDQGDTVTLRSAERPTYVVHYELWYSWAFDIDRELQGNDFVKIGAFNEDNGYYVKKNSTGGDLDAYIVVERNGTVTKTTPITLDKPITDFTRFELRTNWYNAGEQTWIQTITNSSLTDVQQQNILGRTAPNGQRLDGPENPQLPLRFTVHRGSSTPDLNMNAGSGNILVAGDVNIIERAKTHAFDVSVSQLGDWEPVAAIRLEPEADFVRSDIQTVDLAETDRDTDYYVTAQQHSPEKVETLTGEALSNASDSVWTTPEEMSDTNSVIEFTSNISAAANVNGTVVGSTSDSGGFQVGWASLYSVGNKGVSESRATQELKRPIYGEDVVVFWMKAEDEGNPGVPAGATVENVITMSY